MASDTATLRGGGVLVWIPWQRYALTLEDDLGRCFVLGRFTFKRNAQGEADILNQLSGITASVIDTKAEDQS